MESKFLCKAACFLLDHRSRQREVLGPLPAKPLPRQLVQLVKLAFLVETELGARCIFLPLLLVDVPFLQDVADR
ncbi:hypothetical protein DPMN_090241 [Dreissena polymorpha]|uniref:Uncharacterized protein n=1 Tax=Dreissena polymorpha TaxID=45954 RepID=A0A9D4QY17_DREPO|nr:hypothetical protein DPMN_090241 [Dreissena polymorpha]